MADTDSQPITSCQCPVVALGQPTSSVPGTRSHQRRSNCRCLVPPAPRGAVGGQGCADSSCCWWVAPASCMPEHEPGTLGRCPIQWRDMVVHRRLVWKRRAVVHPAVPTASGQAAVGATELVPRTAARACLPGTVGGPPPTTQRTDAAHRSMCTLHSTWRGFVGACAGGLVAGAALGPCHASSGWAASPCILGDAWRGREQEGTEWGAKSCP